MYLSKVEIKNFRSLAHVEVDLRPGLNVLVGRNNTGKTNFLNAIRHALGPQSSRGEAIWLSRDDFYRESPADNALRTISIALTFSDLSPEQRSFFFEIVDHNLHDPSASKAHILFEASWAADKRQPSIRRMAGIPSSEPFDLPSRILESFPVTFLPALRDAEASLVPGNRNRLAAMLRDICLRKSTSAIADLTRIYQRANDELEQQSLIEETKLSLQTTTKALAGSDYVPSAIKTSEADFDRILRMLHVQMGAGAPIGSLDANGLGYNNLLYMAVVLEHLKASGEDEAPLLLVEEPEAHLHPQLATLLAEYLARTPPQGNAPQVLVTTHSPTLASSVPPSRIHVLFKRNTTEQIQCNSLHACGMTEEEQEELQRMLDVTRATLYFAKGALLVEGISETLLIPRLAKLLNHDLAQAHISVIPVCGVAFETISKMLSNEALAIPVAVVTDTDPEVQKGDTWETDCFDRQKPSSRASGLMQTMANHPTVRVFCSDVTLEYDLAAAGPDNARIMANAWESCFRGTPRTFNSAIVAQQSDTTAKAMAAWRGICRADPGTTKGRFAQRLAATLDRASAASFVVPSYIKDALEYVVASVK